MVLLKCIECGGQVSANANRCPKCGTPWYKTQEQIKLEQRESKRKIMEQGPQFWDWVVIIGGGGFLVGFIYLMFFD